MRPTQLLPERTIQSTGRELFSLKVDDIPGARPKVINATKNINHYHQRMVEDGVQFKDYMVNYQHRNNDDIIFGSGRLYPERRVGRIGKRQYDRHWISEIGATETLKGNHGNQPIQSFDYPRSLAIHDIPGAVAGSSKSQALKNHALAEKIRRDNSAPRARPGNESRRGDDSLDRFYKEKSAIVQNYSGAADSQSRSGATYSSLFPDIPDSDRLDSNRQGLNVTSSMKDIREERQTSDQILKTERPPSNHTRVKNVPYYFPHGDVNSMAGIPSDLIRIMQGKNYRGSGRKISVLHQDSQASDRGSDGSAGFRVPREYDQVTFREPEEIPTKKIMTFNIISNTANSKNVPQRAIIPEKYAFPHNFQSQAGNERRSVPNIAAEMNNNPNQLPRVMAEGANQKFQLVRNMIYNDQAQKAQNKPPNEYMMPLSYQRRLSQGA